MSEYTPQNIKKIIRRKNIYSNYVSQIKRVTNTDTTYQNYKDKQIQDEKQITINIIIKKWHNFYT